MMDVVVKIDEEPANAHTDTFAPFQHVDQSWREREKEIVKLFAEPRAPIRMTLLFRYLTSGSGVYVVNGAWVLSLLGFSPKPRFVRDN